MVNESADARRAAQQSESARSGAKGQNREQGAGVQERKVDSEKGARVGQPAEEHRTSQQNAGSTEGGGTRNAGKD
jgi:hypothetical protein